MSLPLPHETAPMEAQPAELLPDGPGWQFEPKWDGFRCLAHRDGTDIHLASKSGQPLARYFPDISEILGRLGARRFILDGELAVPVEGSLSFEALQLRLHPAASRVAKLAAAHPALYVVFDLLAVDGEDVSVRPLAERRRRLEEFAAVHFSGHESLLLSPATTDRRQACAWLEAAGAALDGVIAKRRDQPYRSGRRDGMVKVKTIRTADCVVGGFRPAADGGGVGSLLLGLYDEAGLLNHVGFTSGLSGPQRKALLPRLQALAPGPGFTGRAPGGPSRWNNGKPAEYVALRHELVVEVKYDHVTGGRFRHGTALHRWRPDKAPRQCTEDQLPHAGMAELAMLRTASGREERT